MNNIKTSGGILQYLKDNPPEKIEVGTVTKEDFLKMFRNYEKERKRRIKETDERVNNVKGILKTLNKSFDDLPVDIAALYIQYMNLGTVLLGSERLKYLQEKYPEYFYDKTE